MTYIFNDPAEFADELTAGFAEAFHAWVVQVPGGVVRATKAPEGEVAVVTGGGSGHYPAFAGLVGPGLAHGAAMGNIFASPSAQQVYNVAKAAHNGGGVLFTYGNYAGDVLNFDQAQERLRAEGIPCETVVVTDDVASASPEEHEKRRGIAGDLVVFKAAAAAAEAGKPLGEVVRVAQSANQATRSLGVAFTGCTLPGAEEPLFTVPEGRMGVGMGIHGEPGIDEQDIPSAEGLAELLVGRLLEERFDDRQRAVVLLNGLGSVKYEELFVLYLAVSRRLKSAGIEIVQPDVGELVTSFQMAGVSLTLSWLDDELEDYWAAPVNTPAYRRGERVLGEQRTQSDLDAALETTDSPGSDESQQVARQVLRALEAVSAAIDENVDYLGELDAIAGDGDHGIGMQRGAHAAVEGAQQAVENQAGAAATLIAAADTWADKAGGTSGALWGLLLRKVGESLDNETTPDLKGIAAGFATGANAVQHSGGAELGDKTMVDALRPYVESLEESVRGEANIVEALENAATVAREAAHATSELIPLKGRARPHAEKSVGSPDPGAISFALIAATLAETAAL